MPITRQQLCEIGAKRARLAWIGVEDVVPLVRVLFKVVQFRPRRLDVLVRAQAQAAKSGPAERIVRVQALAVNLAASEKLRLERHYTGNIDAYQNYLEGRYEEFTFTREGMNKAIAYFDHAIADDPSYALAYAGLADAYTTESDWLLAPKEALPKAESAPNTSSSTLVSTALITWVPLRRANRSSMHLWSDPAARFRNSPPQDRLAQPCDRSVCLGLRRNQ